MLYTFLWESFGQCPRILSVDFLTTFLDTFLATFLATFLDTFLDTDLGHFVANLWPLFGHIPLCPEYDRGSYPLLVFLPTLLSKTADLVRAFLGMWTTLFWPNLNHFINYSSIFSSRPHNFIVDQLFCGSKLRTKISYKKLRTKLSYK